MSRRHDVDWMAPRKATTLEPDFTSLTGGVPNILSATSYTQPVAPAPQPITSEQLFGGVVIELQDQQSEPPSRPKKRARASKPDSAESNEGSDEASKKQRGRPKVDSRDETAIDRRRTQIRLAQRAYRNRKESTITTLQHKVEDMQGKLTRMDKIFASLYDNLTGLEALDGRGQASQQLELLRQEFTQMSSLMSPEHGVDGEEATISPLEKEHPTPEGSSKAQNLTSKKRKLSGGQPLSDISPGDNVLDIDSNSDLSGHIALSGDRYKSTLVPTSCPSYFDFSPDSGQSKSSSGVNDWAQQSLDLERAYPLRTSYTYSFQETSFARRLHRFCIETAFRNLGDPSVDPAWIGRIFHFALSYVDRVQLRSKFKALLQRGTGEPLESVDTPFFHVGGAGTHFVRRDATGKPIFPPNLQSPLQAPGPWKLLEAPDDVSSDTVQKLLGAIGYDGEWYDAREVEEYLKTKGIYFEGHETFVDIDASKLASLNAPKLSPIINGRVTSTMVPSLAGHPYDRSQQGDGILVPNEPVSFGDVPSQDFFVNKSAAPEQNSIYGWAGTDIVGNHSGLPSNMMQAYNQTVRSRSNIITLDVAKFLDRVVYGGACLGRAPGFRRAAIDEALSLAIQEAF